VELWNRMSELMLSLIDTYDDQAIFLWLLIEETGFPLPLPGDMAMLLAGYRVGQGKMNLFWALFLLELATVLGASVLYWVGARGGRPLLQRYGRYVRLDRDKLDRAESWIQRRQAVAIIVGRITPGLRNVTVIAAGVFGVPYRTFLPSFALGSFIYIAFFFSLGMWVGPQALETIGEVRLSMRAVVSVVLFVALGAFLLVMYRRAAPVRALAREPAPEVLQLETSVMAGLLATLEMGLGVNVLLYLLSALALGAPERALVQFFDHAAARYAGGDGVRFVALGLATTFVAGLGWAVLYTHVAVPLLRPIPPWLRGLVFSLAPLAVSVLIVMPAMGAGLLGLGLGAGLVPFAGEVVRHAIYGVGLAASYSLLRIARQRPARAAALVDSPSPAAP
jgi:membrane protein DedA with SNARE-associated domain